MNGCSERGRRARSNNISAAAQDQAPISRAVAVGILGPQTCIVCPGADIHDRNGGLRLTDGTLLAYGGDWGVLCPLRIRVEHPARDESSSRGWCSAARVYGSIWCAVPEVNERGRRVPPCRIITSCLAGLGAAKRRCLYQKRLPVLQHSPTREHPHGILAIPARSLAAQHACHNSACPISMLVRENWCQSVAAT